jgi:PAS domain S-box-containing protein
MMFRHRSSGEPRRVTSSAPTGLPASDAQLRAVFSQAAIGIAVADLDACFLAANEKFCHILGYTEEDLLKKDFMGITHPEDAEKTRALVEELLAGSIPNYSIEKRYLRKDGSTVWSNTTVTLLQHEDAPAQFIGIIEDITERKQAEEIKSRLAAVIDSSDDAIITKTLESIITTWNPAAERMFGYRAEEVIGRPVTILIPENQLDEEPEILNRLRRGERIHHYETIRRRKDGTLINVSLSVSPMKDGSGRVVGASKIARDITQQKRDEAQLREHSRVMELLDATGKAISSELELKNVLQRVTDIGTQLSGAQFGAFFYNVTDARGESFLLYTLSGAPREAFEKFGLPRNTPVFNTTFTGAGVVRSDDITKDPRYGTMAPHYGMPKGHLPVKSYLAVPVIARSGKVLGGLFFGHSRTGVFTEHAEKLLTGVAAQAAVAMDNANLYEASKRELASRELAEKRLREADQRKDEFLATLAHELRNPLAPIRQAATLAGGASTTEEQKRWANGVIGRQVQHMSLLLDDLLDISRITRGVLELRPRGTSLAEIVDSAVETARPSIESRRHRFQVELDDASARFSADPLRMAQILANLLTNAAKYTNEGGEITLRAGVSVAEITFSVRDTGIGIAAETLPDLFTMFAQLARGRGHSDGGLGIGLALAKGLAELHGGTIEARSPGVGQGSEFIVRIPRRTEQKNEPDNVLPQGEPVSTRRRVLIADDNEDAARSLAMLLEITGHDVSVAHDGEQALDRFDADRPEFVLLDIGMPRLDGYEVARRLRQRPGGDAVTLIALTGWGQASDKAKATSAGFNLHYTKPVDPQQIIDLLAKA